MNEVTSQTDVQSHERSPTQAARSRVVAALAHLEHGQRDAMEELRTELCSYVGHLRRDGLSREAALADVRSLIAQPATPEGAIALTSVVRDALAELTLQWCEAEDARLAGDRQGARAEGPATVLFFACGARGEQDFPLVAIEHLARRRSEIDLQPRVVGNRVDRDAAADTAH